ncbi:hypothetical protein LCGC14_1589340 [marine sediment metagenome]|uniref:Uncharacterized protein n=1 Tax=marine sediment metagenome TaxID=412755 RepID=A0A0F9KV42_9ZZZZ
MMQFTAYGILFGTILASSASVISLDKYLEGGAITVLGFMAWYFLARVYPAQEKSRGNVMKAYLNALKEEREIHRETVKRLVDTINSMVSKCGGNP